MRMSDWSSDVCSSDLDDDGRSEDGWTDHLARCLGDDRQPFFGTQGTSVMMLAFRNTPQRIFYDDDGTIDDEAEIKCAEAHEVGRNTAPEHAENGHQHGDRTHQRRNQPRAEIAEQPEKHDDDEKHALEKVFTNGRAY